MVKPAKVLLEDITPNAVWFKVNDKYSVYYEHRKLVWNCDCIHGSYYVWGQKNTECYHIKACKDYLGVVKMISKKKVLDEIMNRVALAEMDIAEGKPDIVEERAFAQVRVLLDLRNSLGLYDKNEAHQFKKGKFFISNKGG